MINESTHHERMDFEELGTCCCFHWSLLQIILSLSFQCQICVVILWIRSSLFNLAVCQELDTPLVCLLMMFLDTLVSSCFIKSMPWNIWVRLLTDCKAVVDHLCQPKPSRPPVIGWWPAKSSHGFGLCSCVPDREGVALVDNPDVRSEKTEEKIDEKERGEMFTWH